jgi:hypothetical protein
MQDWAKITDQQKAQIEDLSAERDMWRYEAMKNVTR